MKGGREKTGHLFCMFWKVGLESSCHMKEFELKKEQGTLKVLEHSCGVGSALGFQK